MLCKAHKTKHNTHHHSFNNKNNPDITDYRIQRELTLSYLQVTFPLQTWSNQYLPPQRNRPLIKFTGGGSISSLNIEIVIKLFIFSNILLDLIQNI